MSGNFQKLYPRTLYKTSIVLFAIFSLSFSASSGTELIINGDFSSTETTNWSLSRMDSASVTGAITNGQYVITRASDAKPADTNSWGIQFVQKSVKIDKGKTYLMSFAAKADSSFIMTINVGADKSPWNTYSGYKQAAITNILDTFSFEFSMDSASDPAARLVIDAGLMKKKGTVTLDNISLKGSDPIVPPANELIKNGNFSSSSLANWNLNIRTGSNAKATMKVVGGELEINITQMGFPRDSALTWDVQINQVGLKLEKGKQYQVTWAARCAIPYQIGAYVAMNKSPWGMYSGYTTPYLAEVMDSSYMYSFSMPADTADANGRIGFDLGAVASDSVARKVYFDNISLKCLDCISGVAPFAIAGKQVSQLHAILKDRNLKIAGISSPATVRVYNACGKLIAAVGKTAPRKGTVSITLKRTLAKGVYFAVVNQGASPSSSMQFIKQ
jgi:hypothetical protein